jgi:hypothetical protein
MACFVREDEHHSKPQQNTPQQQSKTGLQVNNCTPPPPRPQILECGTETSDSYKADAEQTAAVGSAPELPG